MTDSKKPAPPPSTDERKKDPPPEGPHAKPELMDNDKTPGAGSLPDENSKGEADAGVG